MRLVAATGAVTPAPGGPHVEQVGWGVGRQVLRRLREDLGDVVDPDELERFGRDAERAGRAAYAVIEGPRVEAVALLDTRGAEAAYTLVAALPTARATGALTALCVRALHDAAAAGAHTLVVEVAVGDDPADVVGEGWSVLGLAELGSGA